MNKLNCTKAYDKDLISYKADNKHWKEVAS